MTEFIKRSTAHATLWWPVIFRGALYFSIAVCTATLSELDDVTAVQLEQMNWLDWSKKAITVVVAGLITLRTFIDQSASEHGVKLKAKNEEHKTEPVSGSGGS